jgi:hypothetical protein
VNPVAKLAGFAAVLVLAFGGAAFAGSRIDVRPGTQSAEQPEAHGMGAADADREGGHGGDGAAPQAVRGLAVSEGGLTLKLTRNTATAGKRSNVAFRIVDRGGQTVRDFDVEHTKRMHVIVVRRDMAGFQHVHPTQRADGSWSVPVTLRKPGSYRVFADFSVAGKAYTVADDVTVDGTVRSQQLPAPVDGVNVDGMRVSMTEGASDAGGEAELGFEVTRDGEPVAIEDYLGAKGHLVALRQGDLAFLHVHPDENALKFMATFPTAGNYRLFLQFQTDGRVHTAAFTQEVAR